MPSPDGNNKPDASSDPRAIPNTRTAAPIPAPYVKTGNKRMPKGVRKLLSLLVIDIMWQASHHTGRCEASPEQLATWTMNLCDVGESFELSPEGIRQGISAAIEQGYLRVIPGARGPVHQLTESALTKIAKVRK